MSWPIARARIANRLEAVSVSATLADGTVYAKTMAAVFERPPQQAIEIADSPLCVMTGAAYRQEGHPSLLTEWYAEEIELLAFDEELASAVEIIDLFRPSIIAIFAADLTLNSTCSRIILPEFSKPESTERFGVNAPGALVSRFTLDVRLDASQTYSG